MKTLNEFLEEGMVSTLKKGVKRHKDAVEKKKIKDRKAVPYAALAAEHTPEGEVIDEISKATLASYIKKGSEDAVERMGDASRAGMSGRRKEADKGYEKAHKRVSGVRKAATKLQYKKEEVVHEGDVHSGQGEKIQKRTKDWMDKKGLPGAPGLKAMKAREAEHKARRGVKGVKEEKEKGLDGKACWKGYRLSGTKKKGGKTVDNCVKEEDKAFDYVVAKLRKQHGDGVLTKGDKMPEPSAAQKKRNAEIRAQRAKEDHRDETEKATSGRYNDRSRSD